jgi:flavin reductase (DIM6/NTAB) family NADH-FMN oxidoreductase RutF
VVRGAKEDEVKAAKIGAPPIAECYASFECKLVDESLAKKHTLFVLEVVKAQVVMSPKFPTTIHYRGDGLFMIAGKTTGKWRKGLKPENL